MIALRRLILFAACWFFAASAFAEARVALVIGNSAYKHAPALANPKNDAEGMAASLKRLRFDVALAFYAGHDLSAREIIKDGIRVKPYSRWRCTVGRNYCAMTEGQCCYSTVKSASLDNLYRDFRFHRE